MSDEIIVRGHPDNPIVKYDNKWWIANEVRNNMVILWRDGERAIVPLECIEVERRAK